MKQTFNFFGTLIICLFTSYSNAIDSAKTLDLVCSDSLLPIDESRPPQLISADFLFLEGPTWSNKDELFYFSEMNFNSNQANGPDSTIYQLSLPNSITKLVEHSGSNGLIANKNQLITLNHNTQSISTLDLSTKKQKILVDNYLGKNFNSPNDATMHSAGHLYFTDPDWQLGDRPPKLSFTGVYWLSFNGDLTLIDKTLSKPNGIVLSPDESRLYTGDFSNQISVYPVNTDGSTGKREQFAKVQSPDGITIDCKGNLYVASHNEGSIYVFSPTGKQLQKIMVTPQITNLEFGGKDLKLLLVTSGTGLYSVKTNISGAR